MEAEKIDRKAKYYSCSNDSDRGVDEGKRKQHVDQQKGVIVWKKQEGADWMSCVHVFAFVFSHCL